MPVFQLQFATADDVVARAIRAYDRGRWSHVDVVLPNDGGLLGSRAEENVGIPAGVHIRPPGYTKFTNAKVVSFPVEEGDLKLCIGAALSQIGKPYDFLDLTANFLLGRDWRNDDAWWCSEFGGWVAEKGVFKNRLATPENLLTPNGLFLASSAVTNVF